jgi:hypothetical protein
VEKSENMKLLKFLGDQADGLFAFWTIPLLFAATYFLCIVFPLVGLAITALLVWSSIGTTLDSVRYNLDNEFFDGNPYAPLYSRELVVQLLFPLGIWTFWGLVALYVHYYGS